LRWRSVDRSRLFVLSGLGVLLLAFWFGVGRLFGLF
jgi:hypothetical protein